MARKKNMFLFNFSITLAILSSVTYHFSARSVPTNNNFAISLIVTNAVSLGITLIASLLFPARNGLAFELKQLNWMGILLAFAIVGIEFGFLLAYQTSWSLGIAAVLVNVSASLILVSVAVFIFNDKLNWVNIVGIFVCLGGLVIIN